MPRKRKRTDVPLPTTAHEAFIPFVTEVAVRSLSPAMAVLQKDGMRLVLRRDGDLDISFDSLAMKERYLKEDFPLSAELQARHENMTESEWGEWLKHWAEPPPAMTFRGGQVVTEWPGGAKAPPRHLSSLGVDDTENWSPYYRGSRLRYAHFQTAEGQEGAVVQWYEPENEAFDPPQVYWGDFSAFMADQSHDALDNLGSGDFWREVNDLFEGVPAWALEKMGAFDAPGIVSAQVLDAIAEDPELLTTESLKKMLAHPGRQRADVARSLRDAAESRGLR